VPQYSSNVQQQPWPLPPRASTLVREQADAEVIAAELGDLMSTDFRGTPIDAEGKVYGRTWRKV
jgi:hypothetical protein